MEIIDTEGSYAGLGSAEEVAELAKALAAGDTITLPGATGGQALQVQSLEGSLKVLTFTQSHAKMWQKIPKFPAYSTVEEYSEQTSHGTEGNSFLPPGITPEEDDGVYARRASYVKYLGTTRKVQHPMTLVRTIGGDVLARENASGITKIIRDVDEALFWGNSALGYNITTTGIEFDGLNKLIDADNIVDCAGLDLTEGKIEDCAEVVAVGYGIPTDLFLSTKAALAFTKTMLPKGRAIYPNAGGNALVAGAVINQVTTTHGVVDLNPSLFLNTGRSPRKTPPASATSVKAPTAPASIVGGAMTGSTGKFRAVQQGDLKFKVTACNRFGESAPTAISAAVTVGAGDLAKYIPLTITNAASVVTPPEWFNIYCTEADGSVVYLVAQVAASSVANDGTTVYNYVGLIMANTSIGFMGQMADNVIQWKQLAPLMKMDLAITGPNISWMILLYGMLQLYAPKQWARIINIK